MVQNKTTLERRVFSYKRKMFSCTNLKEEKTFVRIDRILISIPKRRINQNTIIYEEIFVLESKELTYSFKLGKNF